MNSKSHYDIPELGSLGLLALGSSGLKAWRAKREGKDLPSDKNWAPPGGRKKLLLVGWDAADWKVIKPLLDAGRMPALKKLIDNGCHGNISTLDPILSPMLWTSIATGKYADKHGILGFTEPDPTTGKVRPVSSTSRKVRAIWNILTQQGYKNHLVAWWPSHPAEPINGVAVSNQFHRAHGPIDKAWPVLRGMVHPASLSDTFEKLRIHPDELTEAHILPFIPQAAKIDQEKDHSIGVLSKILADCATVQSSATWIMEHEEWDFMAVYFDAIDHFSHAFMRYRSPRMPGIKEEDFELYKDVIDGAYVFHDMMLERLLQLCNQDTNLILLSDHGFKSDHLRPVGIPKEPAGPAYEHRQFGIVCLSGPAFRKGERISGSTLLDITPTILTLFDLPVGKDMDGVPLLQAFTEEKKIAEIESWENVEGDFGMFNEVFREDPFVAKQALDQLEDLGYIEKTGGNDAKALQTCITERSYNLARVYMSSERSHLALPEFRKLYEEKKEKRFGLHLALCLVNMGETAEARQVLEMVRKEIGKNDTAVDMLHASLLIDEHKSEEALDILEKLIKDQPAFPELYIHIGRCQTSLQNYEAAEKAYMGALALDPERAIAHYGIGITLLRRGRNEEAADAFLNTLSLAYHFPLAHYHLGESLYNLGELEDAARSFEVAIHLNPGINKAGKWLERIYSEKPELKKVAPNRQFSESSQLNRSGGPVVEATKLKEFKSGQRGEMVVVSGLPRSGTSMMMQMLEKGGLTIFTDKIRQNDESNPKGYYEHESVKKTASDKRWLRQAAGKAVKVIAHLLIHLPPAYKYKVIFMQRDMDEIMASQHKMMVTSGKAKEGEYRSGVEIAYRNILERVAEWARTNSNAEILYLDYASVLENTGENCRRISEFLGKEINTTEMASVADSRLYRNKSGKTPASN